jgi:hypothetical protein
MRCVLLAVDNMMSSKNTIQSAVACVLYHSHSFSHFTNMRVGTILSLSFHQLSMRIGTISKE